MSRDLSTTDIVFGRQRVGSLWAPPKLTAAQREEIGFRRLEGDGIRDLAAEFKVSTNVIRDCQPKERPVSGTGHTPS